MSRLFFYSLAVRKIVYTETQMVEGTIGLLCATKCCIIGNATKLLCYEIFNWINNSCVDKNYIGDQHRFYNRTHNNSDTELIFCVNAAKQSIQY